MPCDWATNEMSFYRDVIVDTVVRTGLYDFLRRGVTISELMDGSPVDTERLMLFLQSLERNGWVERREESLYWIADPAGEDVIRRVEDARRWLTLDRRLGFECRDRVAPWVQQAELSRLRKTGEELAVWACETIGPIAGTEWLDVGAGPGTLSEQIAAKGCMVTMADRPEVISWRLQKELPRHIYCWAGNVLENLPDKMYDGIILMRFVEGLSPFEAERLFSRLASQLRPSGSIYVIGYLRDYAGPDDFFDINLLVSTEDGRYYSLSELDQMAETSALTRIFVKPYPPGRYFLVAYAYGGFR